MLHLLYIIAFTVLAFVAIVNLVRNFLALGFDGRQGLTGATQASKTDGQSYGNGVASSSSTPHPEFLDKAGKVVEEPLLVMRSISIDDARERLDALYESSPSPADEQSENK